MENTGKHPILLLACLAVTACLLAFAQAADAQITFEQARLRVLQQFNSAFLDGKAFFGDNALRRAGEAITTWAAWGDVDVTSDCWFFFIDQAPDANWEHPALYVFVDSADGLVTTVPVTRPPNELTQMEALNDLAAEQLQELLDNRLRNESAGPGANIPPVSVPDCDNYALIVSGGVNSSYNYSRYLNDIEWIYEVLVDSFYYTDDQIIVLYADGSSHDLDGGGGNDVDGAATKSNLQYVMGAIKDNIDPNGDFFFYSTNHGGDDTGSADPWDVLLWLYDSSGPPSQTEYIYDHEFAALLSGWTCRQMIFVMEQCYSGGFIDDIEGSQTNPCTYPRVCAMSACKHDESSYSCDTEGDYDEYVYHWVSAINGLTPSHASVDADTNDDGFVSSAEAHAYAVANDSRSETPQTSDCEYYACDCTSVDVWKTGPSCGNSLATDGSDYVGTSEADRSVWRPSNGRWYVDGAATVKHGSPGDLPVPGDYDGNGTLDRAVWRPSNGKWYVYGGSTTKHGQDGDIPVPGNYTGNAATEMCVWRPSNGKWYVYSGAATKHGQSGDIPVPADYDGDGFDDYAIWRPSNCRWYVYGSVSIKHGQSGDIPIPYNADGFAGAELVVFRPSSGRWYVYGGGNTKHGRKGDIPVPGDYGGGAPDMAVWRPSNGRWYVYSPGTNTKHGSAGDIPLVRGK